MVGGWWPRLWRRWLVEEMVGGVSAGWVGLHVKGTPEVSCLLSLGAGWPWEAQFLWVSKAPNVKASDTETRNKIITQATSRTFPEVPGRHRLRMEGI